jgi:hypothetical protein
MSYEIQAVEEGYISQESVKYSKPIKFQSPQSAKLFVDMCEAVDWWNDLDQTEKDNIDLNKVDIGKSYRYSYHPKLVKKAGKVVGCDIVISDIGE